jgi:uracil-DNA glycosylase
VFREQKKLDKLRAEVLACKRCYIGQTIGPCRVFGEGPPNANVMSIAEAAGESEFLHPEGRPFCGKAGDYWEAELNAVGIKRTNLFITNAVNSRPMWEGKSNALSPDFQEVHACQPFLIKKIEIIKPKLLLIFGKTAAYSLGILKKSEPLESKVGRNTIDLALKDGNYSVEAIVTYHPSYLMRGGLKQQEACWRAYNHLRLAGELANVLAET